jgi:hypothetical protein
MINQELCERFRRLFTGNGRSHGEHFDGKSMTVRSEAVYEDYFNHLSGKKGLGIVAIMDDGNCWFSAIDIDCHGADATSIDLESLQKKVIEFKFPLVVCRSKSGGAHLYMFCREPLRAVLTRQMLSMWAEKLGFPSAEIFPKQAILKSGHLGNWLNLPYFDADDTNRYARSDTGKLSLTEFLDLAESRLVTKDDLQSANEIDVSEAPPCVARIVKEGADMGFRNEALYAVAVYLKKSHSEWRNVAVNLSQTIFSRPLSLDEAKRTIDSAGRKDYYYKCRQEPCLSLCDNGECVKKKYGIKSGTPSMPARFDKLIRYNTEPAVWELYVDGKGIKFYKFADLLTYKKVKEEVGDRLRILLPTIKQEQWERMLDSLLGATEERDAPNEASVNGMVASRLVEFVRRSGVLDRDNETDGMHCFMGGCSMHSIDGTSGVLFRLSDLRDYLKKVRMDDAKTTDLWFILESLGVKNTWMKWQNQAGEMCWVPLTEDMEIKFPKVMVGVGF